MVGVGRSGGEKSIGEVYIPMFSGVNGVVKNEDSDAVDREFELEGVDDAIKDRFDAVHGRGHVAVGGGSNSNFEDDKAAGDVVAFPDAIVDHVCIIIVTQTHNETHNNQLEPPPLSGFSLSLRG